jgi:GNAT superfamily N-acetyltransferase
MREDGTPATIRRLWSVDREIFRAHLFRLDPESRHDRFNGGASDEFLNRYADRCFAPRDVIFGAFIEGALRGAGEMRPLEDGELQPLSPATPAHAEAAFSIEREFRRRGLGAQLFERLMRAAANHHISEIDFTCSADNRPMRSLAHKFEAEMHFRADQITGRLLAKRPTIFSLWREAASDAGDYATSIREAQFRGLGEPAGRN